MTGFSDDEIQSVVTSLVQSTIARPIDALGVRRVDISFNDIQQAAGGVFLLYPNSPFYVVALGAARALDLVTSEELLVIQLLDAVAACGRRVLPIQDVSTLFNAQAALQELQSAAAAREASFADITSLPAYQRFSSNVSAFLSGPGQTVKDGGEIVQTPQEAQAAIPALVTQLQSAHTDLVTAVTQLAAAIADFNSLNLPSVVASSVIGNAQTLVGQSATTMNALTPTQRLEQVRQTVLNLLASLGIVATFGSFQKPSEFLSITGTGFSFADATHPANPAVLTSDHGGAFGVITGTNDTLTATLDGGSPVSITLAPSPLAELDSGLDESFFVFGDGTQPIQSGGGIPNNNTFKFRVNGSPFLVVFPPSSVPSSASLTGSTDVTVGGLYGGGGSLNGKTFIITVDGALRSLDTRYEDAGATLGASRFTVMRRVTLPAIAPSLAAGAALTWARALGEFGATITFAGNLPRTTQTMPLAVYLALQEDSGSAIVLSLVLLAVSITVLAVVGRRVFANRALPASA